MKTLTVEDCRNELMCEPGKDFLIVGMVDTVEWKTGDFLSEKDVTDIIKGRKGISKVKLIIQRSGKRR